MPGVISIDTDDNTVIELGNVVARPGTPVGFEYDTERNPPTVMGYQGEGDASLPILTGDASHIFSAMLTQESGNRQVGDNGRPITSPKGAIGIAQVMPGTAREQARIMGIPWDERRYKYDAQYNLTLGRGYFERMMKYYKGDAVLATAAYNAGPGNVDKAIRVLGDPRKGGISYAAWVSGLPSVHPGLRETRDYVRITHRRAAKAQKGR